MVSDNIPGDMPPLKEAYLRNQIMDQTVQLLNAFDEYMRAADGSPVEDQAEAKVDDLTTSLLKKGNLAGHVLLALLAIIVDAADHERVQRFFDEQSELIERLMNGTD